MPDSFPNPPRTPKPPRSPKPPGSPKPPRSPNPPQNSEDMIKQLARVVCICKGIPLAKFLPALKKIDNVPEIHECVGSGDGGCAGRRCSPRIETLLLKTQGLRGPVPPPSDQSEGNK